MKKTPTLLMKELKFLQSEAERLHFEDTERSAAPLDEKMEFRYDTGYSYEKNREEMNKIYEQELRIRSALAKFNSTTKICLLYTSPSPRDQLVSRMPSSA